MSSDDDNKKIMDNDDEYKQMVMNDLIKLIRKHIKSKELESEIKKKYFVYSIEDRFVQSMTPDDSYSTIDVQNAYVCSECKSYFHCNDLCGCHACWRLQCFGCKPIECPDEQYW